MQPLVFGLLLAGLFFLGLGAKMAGGRPFMVRAKLLYAAVLLLVFLPAPLWIVHALEVSGFTAFLAMGVILAFAAVLVYPLVRLPRTLVVFNAERDAAAGLLRETLEKHGIEHEVVAPHYGEPVKLRKGLAFRPHEGWRFTFPEGNAHVLVGRLLTLSIALVSRIGVGGDPALEAAFSGFTAALRCEGTDRTPPDAVALIVGGGILLLAAGALVFVRIFAGG